MLLTLPLSWPISKLLDCLLGEELGTVYDKKKLIELLKVTKDNTDLQKEEVDIVTGALRYKEKTVGDPVLYTLRSLIQGEALILEGRLEFSFKFNQREGSNNCG